MYIYICIYIYIVDQNQCCEKSLSPFAVAVLHQTHSVQHDAFQEQLLISADEEAFLRRERCTEEFNQLEGQDRESNAPNHGLNHTKKPPRRNHHQGPLEDTYKKTYRNFQGIVERHIWLGLATNPVKDAPSHEQQGQQRLLLHGRSPNRIARQWNADHEMRTTGLVVLHLARLCPRWGFRLFAQEISDKNQHC